MLDKLTYYLDFPIKFLFINSKGKALMSITNYMGKKINWYEVEPKITDYVKKSKASYKIQIRRYLGFGFLASFIPGTEAFTARSDYCSSLLKLHPRLQAQLSRERISGIALTPFYFLKSYVEKFNEFARNARFASSTKFIDLLTYLPIVSDIISSSYHGIQIHKKWYKNLIHSILNPIRLISSLVYFLHGSSEAIIRLGEKSGIKGYSPLREVIKNISHVFFVSIRFIVAVIEWTVDLGLIFLATLLLDPLRFVYESVNQFINTKSQEYLYVPSIEFDGIENINRRLITGSKSYNRENVNWKESQGYTLKILTHEENEKYSENCRFYNLMKNQKCFKNTRNFSEMPERKIQKLASFQSQLNDWKKLRQFGIFIKNQKLPPEIYTLVRQKWVDSNENDVNIKSEDISLLKF